MHHILLEYELLALMEWVAAQSLPEGSLMHEIVDPNSGATIAMLDLAWPNDLQEGFSQPVAVLLNRVQQRAAGLDPGSRRIRAETLVRPCGRCQCDRGWWISASCISYGQ